MNSCRTWIAKSISGVIDIGGKIRTLPVTRVAEGNATVTSLQPPETLCLPSVHKPKVSPCKVFLISTYLRKKTDSVNEAEQTELSSPPFDSISSTQFSPFNSAHLLVSSWDAVSSLLHWSGLDL